MIIGSKQYREVLVTCHDFSMCVLAGAVEGWPPSDALEHLNNTLDTTLTADQMYWRLNVMFDDFGERSDDHLRVAITLIRLAGMMAFEGIASGNEDVARGLTITESDNDLFVLKAVALASALDLTGGDTTVHELVRALEIAIIAIELELDDRCYEQEQEDAASDTDRKVQPPKPSEPSDSGIHIDPDNDE